MKLVNLTPHNVFLIDEGGNIITSFPAHPDPPRVEEVYSPPEVIPVDCDFGRSGFRQLGIEIYRKAYQNVELPAREHDTLYIVPLLIAQVRKDRDDLLIPNHVVRDSKGVIIGCRSFATVNREE